MSSNISPYRHRFSRCHDQINTRINHFYSQTLIPNELGCMIWIGALNRNKNGYGNIYLSPGQSIRAHRFSYELHFGAIPEDMCVLHKCDNSLCVAPEHLFLGSQQDNLNDCNKKNRRKFSHLPIKNGQDNAFSKLTDFQVKEIKSSLRKKVRGAYLARQFNVAQSTISAIKHNETWSHIE